MQKTSSIDKKALYILAEAIFLRGYEYMTSDSAPDVFVTWDDAASLRAAMRPGLVALAQRTALPSLEGVAFGEVRAQRIDEFLYTVVGEGLYIGLESGYPELVLARREISFVHLFCLKQSIALGDKLSLHGINDALFPLIVDTNLLRLVSAGIKPVEKPRLWATIDQGSQFGITEFDLTTAWKKMLNVEM